MTSAACGEGSKSKRREKRRAAVMAQFSRFPNEVSMAGADVGHRGGGRATRGFVKERAKLVVFEIRSLPWTAAVSFIIWRSINFRGGKQFWHAPSLQRSGGDGIQKTIAVAPAAGPS